MLLQEIIPVSVTRYILFLISFKNNIFIACFDQSEMIELHNDQEKFGRDPFLNKLLENLPGKVSRYAIYQIKRELPHVQQEQRETAKGRDCRIRKNFCLPCRQLLPYKRSVPLSTIASRWLLYEDCVEGIFTI